MTRRRSAMVRICPTCDAFAGAPCVGPGGVRRSVHSARFKGEIPTVTRSIASGPATEVELIEREIRSTTDFHERHLRLQIATAIEFCESPIERVLMAALVATNYAHPSYEIAMIYGRPRPFELPHFPALHIYPQVSLDGYRLDFLAIDMAEDRTCRFTVVEVDGHDFHERTKRQASHDKKRDRHFTAKGWRVIRFTGSDVWRAPAECAQEIFAIARGEGEE